MPRTLQAVCSLELPVRSRACTERRQLLRCVTALFVNGAGHHAETQIAPRAVDAVRHHLMAALAERVVQFWQARCTLAACAIAPRDTFATPFRDGDNDWISWTLH